MHPDMINDYIGWRGLTLCNDAYKDDEHPYPAQVIFEEGADVRGEKWEQLNAAIGFDEIALLPYKEFSEGLWVWVVPLSWVTDRTQSWYQLHRYVGFMTFPCEKETRPMDALARSYPVIQKDPVFTKGVYDVQNIYMELKMLGRMIQGRDKVLSPLEGASVISALLAFEGMGRMMEFAIKQLPEYTGSQLEEIGEPLFEEWKGMMRQLSA